MPTPSFRPTFFEALTETARAELRQRAHVQRVGAGEPLFQEGELGQQVWVVESGLVIATASHLNGHQAILAIRGAGELVGELAVLDGRPRSASIRAVRPTTALAVPAAAFLELLDRNPSISRALVQSLADRLRAADENRLSLAADPVPVRLAHCLLYLAERFGPDESTVGAGGAGRTTGEGAPPPSSAAIELPLSQEDLAGLVGASRDAVAKTLRVWRDAGIVETGRRRLVVADVAALDRMSG